MSAKTVNIKVDYDGVRSKVLPSPSRFLELQGIKDRTDIEELTKNVLKGEFNLFSQKLTTVYNKQEDDIQFLWSTYNDLIFRYVMLSVSID